MLLKIVNILLDKHHFLEAQGQTEKGNVLEEFQALIVDPNLTWEEQNELYRTLIDYIQYIWGGERVKIQIGINDCWGKCLKIVVSFLFSGIINTMIPKREG